MSIPLRWRLLDERTGSTLTECADVDGLVVDRAFPAEPLRERYTLVGCAPSGPLLAAIEGSGPAWLGNMVVEGAHAPGRPTGQGGSVPPTVSGYRLIAWESDSETPAGECRGIGGLFHHRPEIWTPGPPVTLLGCRPGLTGPVEAESAHVRVDGAVHKMGWGGECRGQS